MTGSNRVAGRRGVWAAVLLLAVSVAWAQEGPGAGDLKKMYDDAVAQLKASQERKNELAAENEQLQKKLADIEKTLLTLKARNDDLERESAGVAERTFSLRSTDAAWRDFVRLHPAIKAQWDRHLLRGAAEAGGPGAGGQAAAGGGGWGWGCGWLDPNWPLSSAR
jgi:hypothetical protein